MIIKASLLVILVFISFNSVARPTGAPICDVFANYSNVTGMSDRIRNLNSGPFQLSANVSEYTTFEHVEITITGGDYIGLMFTVEDESGNKVGSFSPDTQVRDCGNQAMSITHTSAESKANKTLFWIPPSSGVGTVYISGYVLSGTSGNRSSQQFYRFVKSDQTALSLSQSDTVFRNSFE